jgi:DNA-binding response OmpR family regulator
MAGETILVVDDEPFVRGILETVLTRDGYRTVVAMDGVSGLEAFRSAQPPIDLVLTNMAMPRMDGLALARTIRAESPGTPILFCTGGGRLREEHVIELGPPTYRLLKPFQVDDLRGRVRGLLDQAAELRRGEGR